MKKILILFLSLIFLVNFVFAYDVAYIHDSPWKIDSNILDSFSDLGLSVETIQCSSVSSTDFSEYDLIFVGEEWLRCASEIPIDEYASLIMNGRNTEDLGITGRMGISKVSSNTPLMDSDDDFCSAYTRTKYSRRYLSMYSLLDYDTNDFTKIAEPYVGENIDLGASVAYIESGTELTNENTAEENICFFGLTETRFWTQESSDLFEDCVEFVIGPLENVHDIALSDLKLTTTDGEEVTGDLTQDESYKVLIDVFNLGDFTEDVSFEGKILSGDVVVDTFSHVSISDLEPGESKNDKSRTVNFDVAKGDYVLSVEAIIDDADYYPSNNIVTMDITVD